MKKLGSYKGFEISVVVISDNNQKYTGYVATRTGIRIESPSNNPLNRRALKQSINELISKR
ncbi:hypothetical protein G7050_02865 [Dysgonomonas sp. HDW5A]|uniref:hypothetical protein n=1 Tax=Dysgonomonas sp. HDW5A TaxID=2714926 RepID=UPI00140BBB15|nr:hypothetical protein [Dysgonomonas sp. HDW5A]QIK58838.1 hypothetical protein G7050_02865 [Dysgonomonas sp. HDW5A]